MVRVVGGDVLRLIRGGEGRTKAGCERALESRAGEGSEKKGEEPAFGVRRRHPVHVDLIV